MLHEDLLLRPAPAELAPARWPSLDPSGGEELVDRPVRLDLLVVATEDGFEVLPGGIARTADDGPETLKDVWVAVPESAAMPDEEAAASAVPDRVMLRSAASTFPTMTRSIGADLFWFGRYLERVDATARLLRTVLDASNDLDAERSRSAGTARTVLLRAVTEVTTTYPGFVELDLGDGEAVRTEIESLLTDAARPGSLAQSSAALAHTTRSLRDLFSDDVWPVFTRMRMRTRGGLPEHRPLEQHPLEERLSAVVDGCLTLSGAVADAMPRDLGWDLTEIGRKIERTMTLLTLLRATLGRRRTRSAEERIAGAVALITESSASYRRAYHAAVQPELLVELLLSDTTLPRSIAFQLDRLGQALDRLPEPAPSPDLRAPMSALRARLAGWEPAELLGPLPGATPDDGVPTALLAEVDAATASLRELATALEDRFFRRTEAASRWGVDDV